MLVVSLYIYIYQHKGSSIGRRERHGRREWPMSNHRSPCKCVFASRTLARLQVGLPKHLAPKYNKARTRRLGFQKPFARNADQGVQMGVSLFLFGLDPQNGWFSFRFHLYKPTPQGASQKDTPKFCGPIEGSVKITCGSVHFGGHEGNP